MSQKVMTPKERERAAKITAINFKSTLIDLLQDLKDHVLRERDEQMHIATAIVALENVEPSVICERSKKLAKDKKILESVEKRDRTFFIKQDSIFQGLPSTIVHKYKTILVQDHRITPDVLKVVWSYIDQLVKFITKWQSFTE